MNDFAIPSSASFTEFLRDYLKSNTLPNTLSQADDVFECDFKNIFEQNFLMREIGFDTEEMFTQKLNVQINIMLPYYKNKASKLKILFNDIFENGFTITQTNNLTNAIISDITNDLRVHYDTPIDNSNAPDNLPNNAISNVDKNNYSRSGSNTNTGTITTLYSKNPKYNSYEALSKFQEEFKNIILECLEAFDCLFMQVF